MAVNLHDELKGRGYFVSYVKRRRLPGISRNPGNCSYLYIKQII